MDNIIGWDAYLKNEEELPKNIVDFDPNKDYGFSEEDRERFNNSIKELEKEYSKVLAEKGFVTTIEMGKLVDRVVCGMSEEDIKLKYAYFDYFGIR